MWPSHWNESLIFVVLVAIGADAASDFLPIRILRSPERWSEGQTKKD
jgi:hypothetical protein